MGIMQTKVRRIQFGTQPRFILFIYNRFDLACGAMAGQMKLDIRWAISGSSLSVIHAHMAVIQCEPWNKKLFRKLVLEML